MNEELKIERLDRKTLTPMMQQYIDIKLNYMDYVLMYRLGDFYEMFFDDAVLASRILEITLTGRNCGLEERAPLCGVPYHSVDGYIKKLVDAGIKVAICEQTEDPAASKGLVKREVVRMITPGTVIDPEMLDEQNNNYIAALYIDKNNAAVAYCDITTGTFKAIEIDTQNRLQDELLKINPSEIIISNKQSIEPSFIIWMEDQGILVTPFLDHYFDSNSATNTIKRILSIFSVEALGLSEAVSALCASGGLLSYIEETAKVPLSHIVTIEVTQQSKFMVLDKFTRRNLELMETMRSKEKKGSLLWVLDKTNTAMGARKLRNWIEEPLLDLEMIRQRHESVEILMDDLMLRSDLRTFLKQIYDLERLSSKLVYGNVSPRDLIALKHSLSILPDLKHGISDCDEISIQEIYLEIDDLTDVYAYIDRAINEEPPFTTKDGGVIKTTFNEELKSLRDAVENGKKWILDIESKEKTNTGIKTLKVGYNKVFGYFIEISKGSASLAPEHYIRKQTLSNAERFITPELKEIEEKVLGAEEKMVRLEAELFKEVKQTLLAHIHRIQKTANAVASLDVLISFAECSYRYGYKKPKMSSASKIHIKNGRHPVIERIFNESPFVANDTFLDDKKRRFYIITGPNMAGKSTYLRQVALITLMAQIGCFVPADEAEIGIVDRIFTRVGASDDLSQGQSTFMVEMNELANILNNATPKSLIILDEIGRGTSTYDGLSIAWSVVEYIAKNSKIHARTLFATHYHELTELEGLIEGVKNYRIAVKEVKDDIIFLRKIEPGGVNQSYGIQVAHLAGVPKPVIDRAKIILKQLEMNDINRVSASEIHQTQGEEDQFEGDEVDKSDALYKYIGNLEINAMTPIEALNALHEAALLAEKKIRND